MFPLKGLFPRRKVVWEFRSTFGESVWTNKYERWGQKDKKVHINFSETNQLCLVGLGYSCCQQQENKGGQGGKGRGEGKQGREEEKGQEIVLPQTQYLSHSLTPALTLALPLSCAKAAISTPIHYNLPHPSILLMNMPRSQLENTQPLTTSFFLKLYTKLSFSKPTQSSPTSITSTKAPQTAFLLQTFMSEQVLGPSLLAAAAHCAHRHLLKSPTILWVCSSSDGEIPEGCCTHR